VLKQAGWTIAEPDPNSSRPFAHGRVVPPSGRTAQPLSQSDPGRLATHSKPTEPKPAAPRPVVQRPVPPKPAASKPTALQPTASSSAQQRADHQRMGGSGPRAGDGKGNASEFERHFGGKLAADSVEGQRVLGARAAHAVAERDSARNGLGKRLDVLAKKDALSEKAQQATCLDIKAHRCDQCDYLAERQGAECKAAGHQTRRVPCKKRGFSCAKCRHHTTALNQRWPTQPCAKCGGTNWKDAGMRRESAAPVLSSEFQPRGEEHGKFRNSAPQPQRLDEPGTAHVSSGREASSCGNAWQTALPEAE
jgi:hypothetical protein